MSEKKFCDECGKEIKKFGKTLYGSSWKIFGFISSSFNGDFCSVKCLKKTIEKLK